MSESETIAQLEHNILAMKRTKQSPHFVQVLVTFQVAKGEIERLSRRVHTLEGLLGEMNIAVPK